MKNKREIVESKYPPRNNEDIWLKDLQLYTSTTKGWQPLGSEKTYSNKEELLADKPAGGTIGIDKETGIAYLYNDVSKEWTPVGDVGESITQVTWQELKDKRDNGQLIPGALYRITDYQCTTTQENTQSAGHQFDIVLLALSENKLAEEGWAMEHPTDVYDVTFEANNTTIKCYKYVTSSFVEDGTIYECWNLVKVDTLEGMIIDDAPIGENGFIVDEVAKTIFIPQGIIPDVIFDDENLTYNYFQNSNLSAWKVWYCLDNDTARFAWADDNLPQIEDEGGFGANVWLTRHSNLDFGGKFAWRDTYGDVLYSDNINPKKGDKLYIKDNDTLIFDEDYVSNIKGFGRGVIYRLIDEWNNDCPYDFKNIQTKLDGEDVYEYTFYTGSAVAALRLDTHADLSIPFSIQETTFMSTNNKIGYFINEMLGEGHNIGQFLIPFVHLEFIAFSNTIGSHASQVKLKQCSVNTIGDVAEYISLDNVRYSSFGQNCGHNGKIIISNKENLNYGNNGVELATKDDIGNIETALNNI